MAFAELGDLADDVRRLFEDLDRVHPQGCRVLSGECSPELDLYETPDTYEVVMDLPGVPSSCIAIMIKNGTVVIVGRKAAPDDSATRQASFHRVERSFGRFARAVRLPGAFDAGRARASLRAGELAVTLPRIAERRGREVRVSIEGA